MNYCRRTRCLCCDRHGPDEFSASVYNSDEVNRFCKRCGSQDGWYDTLEYWVSTAVWNKPWTWLSGYMVKRVDNKTTIQNTNS